jgi:hypothetical protein
MLEVRGARPNEVDAAIECAGRAFGRDDPDRVRSITEFFSKIHKEDPYFRPDNSRIAVVDGVVASVVQVFDREMLIQGVPVPHGGIGSVGTDPRYTRQGLNNKVLVDTAQYMTDRGIVLSSLGTGIHDHYGKVGWQRPDHHAYLEVSLPKHLPAPSAGVAIRQMDWDADRDAVARIHSEFNRDASGPIHRTPELWESTPRWRGVDSSQRYVAEIDGQIVAYRHDGGSEEGSVDEVSHADGHEAAAFALLTDFLAACRERGAETPRVENITFLPWLESIGAGVQVGYHGGWMHRINDLGRLLSLLAPTMSRRLAESGAKDWAGVVGLDTEIGAVTLSVANSEIVVGAGTERVNVRLTFDHRQAIALIMGQARPATFAEGSVDPAPLTVLDALFPPTEYRWYGWDGF